jgi:peptide/nickel transport system ATP-binding protein
MKKTSPLVELRELRVSYRSGAETAAAVQGVSLVVQRGETVAIVGESGSGKSTVANAIIGLLPDNARFEGGAIVVDGEDLSDAPDDRKHLLRGRVIALVPQDPHVGLNPTTRIGKQIGEALILARGRRYRGLDADVLQLLEQVGLDQPVLRAHQYPHELSGGMRQRVLIAIALAGNPALIIADEPTSALDVTVQRKILDHLAQLVRERNIALLIITHDLGVAADRADRVLVMHAGRIVEQGAPATILVSPQQEYTRQLIAAAPGLNGGSSLVLKHPQPEARPEILRIEGLTKEYVLPDVKGQARKFTALDNADFVAHAGQTLAIVGESGSGKSTTLRIALGLEKPTRGHVFFEGQELSRLSWNDYRPLRRRIQLVQQNPFASLDPRFTVFQSIVEPLVSFGLQKGRELEASARRLIDLVHLPAAHLNRLPRELSGGQRQRVAIARAMALGPDLLFLDEPVSALDVSVQAQILALLAELQDELGVSYVLVSHDLAVVASVAHRVAVLNKGVVVEQGPIGDVFGSPASDYTKELLAAVPGRKREAVA